MPRSISSRTKTTRIITIITTPYKDAFPLPEEDFCAVVVVGTVVLLDIVVVAVVLLKSLIVVEAEEVEVVVETELVEVVTFVTTSNLSTAAFTLMFVLLPANVMT